MAKLVKSTVAFNGEEPEPVRAKLHDGYPPYIQVEMPPNGAALAAGDTMVFEWTVEIDGNDPSVATAVRLCLDD